jgi:hypothetical protein
VEEINVAGWNEAEDLLEGKQEITSGKIRLKVAGLDVKILIKCKRTCNQYSINHVK